MVLPCDILLRTWDIIICLWTRMWANAQPDGHPVEHRWCPLFNDAKFGWLTPTTRCRAVMLPRSAEIYRGAPNYRWISATSGPKFAILWGHVETYCWLTSFFPIVDMCLSWEDIYFLRYSPTKLCSGAPMAIFGDFFASCIFREPCAARFRLAS